ncbi:hypothetical protein Ahy_A03g012147 [Arachis hypogaea]|uniref:FAR1 domain-containing protein n=1 Tax=Arachis hypogaea TaxID=3818 RepID=A0A445DST4_ARAHY|nr:hypothetical protein Ahy_A03g012147 [Arachis hypogaea]
MSGIFTDTEMNEQYQEDDDFNQQEELVSDQDMMDEQNEFEQDFRDEFTEGAFFSESDMSDYIVEAAYAVDSVQDITSLKFSENFAEEIGKYHFSTLQLAFDFYMKYSKSKGFSARKSKTFKNSSCEIYRQMFVCHRQGFRMEKYYTMEKRKKEPRLETRTGCEARMDVKFVPKSGRWHIFYFSDQHNHDLLDTQFSAMLPAHRKMSEADSMQMMNMLKSGISTSQIFGLLASQAGGYEFVGYGPRDMYNEIARQRCQIPGDAARLIEEFGIEDKPWVINMYEEKHMWATAYLRGKFFAGFRTTSRCEGLHSVVGRYVGSRYDLTSFVEHFQRCVAHMRFNEFNADYESTRGVPVMQTCIELLERYAAELYTHEIFLFFRPFLSRAGSMRVLNIDNTDDCIKYIVCKHGRPDFTALVEFSKQLAAVAAKVPERYEETRDLIMGLYSSYKAADEGDNQPHSGVARSSNPYVHPTTGGSGQPSKKKKRQRCSVCQMEGHKKTTCPWQKDIDNNIMENEAIGSDDGDMCTEATAELDSDS